MKRSTIITLIVLVLIALGIGVYVYSVRSRPIEIEVATAKKGEVEDIVSASGKVEANRLIPLISPYTDKVVEILVKEGDHVDKDQDLIDLDSFPTIESPISGTVVKIDAKVDQTIGPGAPILTVADMNPTYVNANVDETDISKVKVGQAVNISLDSYPNAKVTGEVSEIGLVATMTQTGGTAFPVKVKITSAEGVTLRVGMSADADIILARYSNVTVIPIEAVTSREGKDVAFLINNSQARMKEVKLGLLSDDYYEIKEGLIVGDKVATKGVSKLVDGAKVKVTKEVD